MAVVNSTRAQRFCAHPASMIVCATMLLSPAARSSKGAFSDDRVPYLMTFLRPRRFRYARLRSS